MKNSIKRTLSAVMAITMVASATSLNVFAEDPGLDDANSTTLTSTVAETALPDFKFSLPTTSTSYIDPYQINQMGQVYSTKSTVVNNSNVPVKVTLTGVYATGVGAATLFTSAPKATSEDYSKNWVVPSISVTDGINKTTTKVLADGSGDNGKQDISISTVMAPMGGKITYSLTGTCALNPTTAWVKDDGITMTNAFKFEPQTYASYVVASAPKFWNTKQATTVTLPSSNVPALSEYLPSTLSNGGKELPVVWYKDGGTSASDLTTTAAAGTYVAKVADEDIYVVTGTFDMPSITIAAASGN